MVNSVYCLRVGILWGALRGWHHLIIAAFYCIFGFYLFIHFLNAALVIMRHTEKIKPTPTVYSELVCYCNVTQAHPHLPASSPAWRATDQARAFDRQPSGQCWYTWSIRWTVGGSYLVSEGPEEALAYGRLSAAALCTLYESRLMSSTIALRQPTQIKYLPGNCIHPL